MIKRSCRIGVISAFLLLSACGGGGQTPGSDTQSIFSTDTGTATDTVAPAQLGTLSLKWAAPATRVDGDPIALSEIASYTVYIGTSRGEYPYSVAVEDPTTTAIDIPDLPTGTYYLVMTATDTQGRESGYSSVAVKEVT